MTRRLCLTDSLQNVHSFKIVYFFYYAPTIYYHEGKPTNLSCFLQINSKEYESYLIYNPHLSMPVPLIVLAHCALRLSLLILHRWGPNFQVMTDGYITSLCVVVGNLKSTSYIM